MRLIISKYSFDFFFCFFFLLNNQLLCIRLIGLFPEFTRCKSSHDVAGVNYAKTSFSKKKKNEFKVMHNIHGTYMYVIIISNFIRSSEFDSITSIYWKVVYVSNSLVISFFHFFAVRSCMKVLGSVISQNIEWSFTYIKAYSFFLLFLRLEWNYTEKSTIFFMIACKMDFCTFRIMKRKKKSETRRENNLSVATQTHTALHGIMITRSFIAKPYKCLCKWCHCIVN